MTDARASRAREACNKLSLVEPDRRGLSWGVDACQSWPTSVLFTLNLIGWTASVSIFALGPTFGPLTKEAGLENIGTFPWGSAALSL
jgi:hypothetical protein